MKRPDENVVKQLTAIAKQYPDIVQYLSDWQMQELIQLPLVSQNTAQAQGRCQVLGELVKLFRDAPSLSAKA